MGCDFDAFPHRLWVSETIFGGRSGRGASSSAGGRLFRDCPVNCLSQSQV